MPGVVLVTGGHGFAGRHLVEGLRGGGDEVIAPSRAELDMLDGAGVREFVPPPRPERLFHLAALASVSRSWDEPRRVLAENQDMTLNVLEAVREEAPTARLLLASSGEVYGPPTALPVSEDARLAPRSPYAVSKAASELLGGLYADTRGLAVVRTRAFNHAGPGQSDTYVIGTITRQVAEAEAAGETEVVLRTGNPDVARDFTDVRDVVNAYRLAIALEPGTYNVASGRALTVRELVETVRGQTAVKVSHEVDPARVREHDVPEIRGSAARLHAASGWKPEIPIERTVADALDSWRRDLSGSG